MNGPSENSDGSEARTRQIDSSHNLAEWRFGGFDKDRAKAGNEGQEARRHHTGRQEEAVAGDEATLGRTQKEEIVGRGLAAEYTQNWNMRAARSRPLAASAEGASPSAQAAANAAAGPVVGNRGNMTYDSGPAVPITAKSRRAIARASRARRGRKLPDIARRRIAYERPRTIAHGERCPVRRHDIASGSEDADGTAAAGS